MKEVCAKYKSSISKAITRKVVQYIYVEDNHKLLYCQVPKAGCSNWKRTLMVLAGRASNTDNIKHDTVHYGNGLRVLNSFDPQGIMHRLKTYTKIMFVREPMARVVSAYRDKLENPNPYYHNLFGKPIISKYRVKPSQQALKTGDGVKFEEFVQYLLDVHRPVGMDIHWEQANQLCHPCLIDYDFIGKFETMEEESNFLLRLTGAPPSLRLPTFKDRNPKDKRTSHQITENYFSQVSMLQKQRVYDFYYMDYLMFNYTKPFKELYWLTLMILELQSHSTGVYILTMTAIRLTLRRSLTCSYGSLREIRETKLLQIFTESAFYYIFTKFEQTWDKYSMLICWCTLQIALTCKIFILLVSKSLNIL